MSKFDIEQLVREAASGNSRRARQHLFRSIAFVEVYFPYRPVEQAGRVLQSTPLARLSDGSHAMMLFTSKSHPHLSEHEMFAGSAFKDMLAAAYKMAQLDWVFLLNQNSQRVAIVKQEIPDILASLDGSSDKCADYTVVSEIGQLEDVLEKLITGIVASKKDFDPETVISIIGDRELFLELSPESSSDGQLQMKTFRIEHMHHVIRVYTSRRRPHITYGGITWQAIKEMMQSLPDVEGVQVMNNAADWVVFHRDALGLKPSAR